MVNNHRVTVRQVFTGSLSNINRNLDREYREGIAPDRSIRPMLSSTGRVAVMLS